MVTLPVPPENEKKAGLQVLGKATASASVTGTDSERVTDSADRPGVPPSSGLLSSDLPVLPQAAVKISSAKNIDKICVYSFFLSISFHSPHRFFWIKLVESTV